MITRNSLTWILSLVALTLTAFFTGRQWPRAAPNLVIDDQPPQARLSLEVAGDKLTGQAPREGSLMIGPAAVAPGESFKIDLNKAFPLSFWTDKWAITLGINNSNNLVGATKEGTQVKEAAPGPKRKTVAEKDTQKNFVASKSGTKYHPVKNCSYADRIKPTNKIFFATEEEARAAGYKRSSCFK